MYGTKCLSMILFCTSSVLERGVVQGFVASRDAYPKPRPLFVTSLDVEDVSSRRCPLAMLHRARKDGSVIAIEGNESRSNTTNYLLGSMKLSLFNLRREIQMWVLTGLFLCLSWRNRHPSYSTRRIASRLNAEALAFLDKVYELIRKRHPLRILVTTATSSPSTSLKLEVVSRIMAEQFVLKKMKDLVPDYHPDFHQHNRDFTNLFMFYSSGVTYEQILSNPQQMAAAFADLTSIVDRFQAISISTIASDYLNASRVQALLFRAHEKMGLTAQDFNALDHDVEQVVKKLLGEKHTELTRYFMERFSTDINRNSIITNQK